MKNKIRISLIVLIVLFSIKGFSQRYSDIEINFTQPNSDTVVGSSINYKISIKNIGPDTIKPTDSVKVWFEINGNRYNLSGRRNEYSKINFSVNLNPNQTFPLPLLNFPMDSLIALLPYNKVCIKGDHQDINFIDSVQSNNSDCYVLNNSTSSIYKIDSEKVKISFNNQELSIASLIEGKVEYGLFSTNGKLLDQGVFNNSTQINLRAYPSGLYVMKLMVNGKIMTKKIIKSK